MDFGVGVEPVKLSFSSVRNHQVMVVDGGICHLVFFQLLQELGPRTPVSVRCGLCIFTAVRHFEYHMLVLAGPNAGHHSVDFTWQGMY